MTIFERIKNKATQALNSVGNFIDRDKQMPGVQIVPGGIRGGIDRVQQSFQQNPKQYNLFSQIKPTADRVLDYQSPNMQMSLRDAIKETAPTVGTDFANAVSGQGTFLQDIPVLEKILDFNGSYIAKPIGDIPKNIGTIADPNRSKLDKGIAGLSTVGAFLPGIDDAAVAAYFSGKEKLAGNNQYALDPEYESSPLGDILRNRGYDGVGADVLDIAELPLLFGGVIASGGKGADNFTKRADEAAGFLKRADGADELVKPLKTAKDTIFVTPSGTSIKPRVQPKSTASLDEILRQAEEIIPGGSKVADDIGGLLTAGKQAPALPAGSEVVDPLTQAATDLSKTDVKPRGLLRQGYDYLMTQTPERLKRVFGDEFYGRHLDPVITRLNTASKSADDFINEKLTNIGRVADDLGIKVGTEDSKLLYTLRDDGFDAVAAKVGGKRAQQIQELYNAMRASYDEVYDLAAPIAADLGKNLPKKEDFLSQQGNKALGFNIDLTSGKTITDETSSSIFKEQGATANVDPLEAYTLYMNKVANLLFMEPEAKQIENLSAGISKNANADQLSELESLRKSITGEGQEFSTARKLFDKYFGQVKSAAIVGKGSTLINQVLGIPGAIGNTGVRNFIMGNLDPKTRQAVKQHSSLFSSVNKDIPKTLQGTKIHQRIFQGMADALQSANKFGYETSLRGFVKQAERQGMNPKQIEDIVAQADKAASRVLGDRRAWMQPKFYDTFFGKLVAPFTTEQTAQAASFLQNIGDKKAATVMKTLIGWKIGNEIWEEVAGFAPFFDPVQAAQDSAELFAGSDEKEQSNIKGFMRLVEEGLTLLPPIQSMVNQAYSIGESAGVLPDSRDVFANDRTWMSTGSLLNPLSNIKVDFEGDDGEKWLPRNITGNKVADTALNIGAKYIPGLEQVNRSVQSLNTMNRGYAESRKGNPLFEAPDTLPEQAKALIFGQSSTKNAQEMFNNDFDWGLYGDQADVIKNIPTREGKIEYLNNTREKNTSEKRVESFLDSGRGGDLKSSDLEQGLFEGKKTTSGSIQERMDAYKELNKILTDDTLPESYKQAAIEASGADPVEAQYYTQAAQDVDVKLQDVILPKLDSMSNEEVMDYLASQRRVVGGKQMLTSTMIDYLYERDYISKGQKNALKALQYDEIKDEFYYKKSYSGGGGGKLSYSQALKVFNVELPKFSKLKSLDFLSDSISTGTSQTARAGETLLSDILSGAPKANSNKGLWFNS